MVKFNYYVQWVIWNIWTFLYWAKCFSFTKRRKIEKFDRYEDESGNQGLNISFIYNSIKGDAGRPVFEIEGKASIGLQVR